MTVSPIQPARIVQITEEDGTVVFKSLGDWTVNNLQEAVQYLDEFASKARKTPIQWEVSSVDKIESAGLGLLFHYSDFLSTRECRIDITGQTPEFQDLYELLRPMATAQAVE